MPTMTTRALIVARLSATSRLLGELTSDVTVAQAWTAPAPGEWSIGEVVRHLVEGDRDTFLPRLRSMLAEERPVFSARRPTTGEARDLAILLAEFQTAREQVVKTLAGLDGGGWKRDGVSPSRGPLTVEAYAQSMSEHDTEHLGQIHQIRETFQLRPKRCEARIALSTGDLVTALEAAPARLAATVAGLAERQRRHRPAPGEWCINEVMAHLLNVETELFLPRLRRIAAEDAPAFSAFSPEPWARERDHSGDPLDQSLAAFERARAETVAFLRALPADAGERLGVSAFFGPVSLWQYATHIADHDLEHLGQMAACRRAAGT